MKKSFFVFLKRFGWFGFVRVVFYPLTALLTTPMRLLQALWSCRVLARGGWEGYNHFSAYAGVGYLIYWTIALNLCKFGRLGRSPYIGLGRYPLSRFFAYSLVSLYPYWKASTILLLFGMFGWIFVHLIWLNCAPSAWVLIVILLALISTTFYTNTFVLQNYNVLGWLFFPLGLYGIYTKNWVFAAIAWLLVSFGSFTAAFLAGILSAMSAIMNLSIIPVLAFMPAGIKLLTHLYPFLITRDLKHSFLSLMRILGMYNKSAKYKYTHNWKTILTAAYFLVIYGQFLAALYLISGKIPVIFLTGLIIFMLNSSLIIRCFDAQSGYMLVFSLATAEILQVPDPRLLLSYWILASPLALFITLPFMRKVLDVVPAMAPFSVKRLENDMETFFARVNPKERVFMAFNCPNGRCERLFDGQTALFQLASYVASKKGFHLMPDFYAISDSSYQGEHNFWGRDVDSVTKNSKFWEVDYVIIYQDSGTKLSPAWGLAGYEVLSRFSWRDRDSEFRGMRPYDGNAPDWWLIKKS